MPSLVAWVLFQVVFSGGVTFTGGVTVTGGGGPERRTADCATVTAAAWADAELLHYPFEQDPGDTQETDACAAGSLSSDLTWVSTTL